VKLFQNVREALAWAAAGGQALHIYRAMPEKYPRAPAVFRRYRTWAHLLDQDRVRLERTARGLGVRIIRVDRPGSPGQHIDLCGRPLARAMELCRLDEGV
jgi:hypothetical protein